MAFVGGVDVSELEPSHLRTELLSVVPQEPALLAGSLYDNIALGRPGASDAEVHAAAATLHEVMPSQCENVYEAVPPPGVPICIASGGGSGSSSATSTTAASSFTCGGGGGAFGSDKAEPPYSDGAVMVR